MSLRRALAASPQQRWRQRQRSAPRQAPRRRQRRFLKEAPRRRQLRFLKEAPRRRLQRLCPSAALEALALPLPQSLTWVAGTSISRVPGPSASRVSLLVLLLLSPARTLGP